MQVPDMPSPAGILMMDSQWLIWQRLIEAIQRALLISPDPYPIPSDASTCRHPIHSSLTDFSENVFQSSLLYRNRLFGKCDSMVMF